ncbi:MAG TPA: mechanosensitive ion channel domain-containing protein [Gaiellaceae bacterium]|nr:mechanosensitive ion channel domain-containing protein [Gaiellaceae bacterium]
MLEHHGMPLAAAKAVAILAVFAVASVVARLAGVLAGRIQARAEAENAPSPLVALSRRETAVSLAQTTIRYFVFLVAIALAVVIITNGRAVGAVAGASFVAVMIAFAAQRFLMDVIAGIVMFFEGWYTVGTSVVIEPWKLEGVVEEVSLRATKIRDASGEVLRVHNSQVLAVRVLPDGALGFEIELFVHDGDAARALVERVASIVPVGPTAFVLAPTVREVQELDGDLYRVTARASVAPGRGWLATDLLSSLLKERADEGLLVHGPVVMPVDDSASGRFARAGRLRSLRAEQRHKAA